LLILLARITTKLIMLNSIPVRVTFFSGNIKITTTITVPIAASRGGRIIIKKN